MKKQRNKPRAIGAYEMLTYSFVVRNETFTEHADKTCGSKDLIVSDGDPLVDERGLLGICRDERGVGGKGCDCQKDKSGSRIQVIRKREKSESG